jgi:hypothetical protein
MQPVQKAITQMSIQEKLKIANNIYIWYPRFKEILTAIEYCHHFSISKDEPECMFLAGKQGLVKQPSIKLTQVNILDTKLKMGLKFLSWL